MSDLRSNIFAASTRRTYLGYLQSYLKFCNEHEIAAVPISDISLGRYIASLSFRLSYSSLNNYLTVVRLLHLEAGYDNPLNSHFIQGIVKGARRVLGHVTSPKLPITPAILLDILLIIDLDQPRDICFWAACLVAFFSFFRKSNLLPSSLREFDPRRHLSRNSVKFNASGVVLSVTWSKTIQYQERVLSVPLPHIQNSPLCPSRALMLLFKLSPCTLSTCPAFQYSSPTGLKLLTYDAFLVRLRKCLSAMGIDPAKYSGHSFRRGGASFAMECGLSSDLIQSQGDWRSDAYKHYIDPSLSYRQEVAKTLGQVISQKFC